jgi:YVTN family beta-propeller protein
MGITDYGVSPLYGNYTYSTTTFTGSIYITNLSIRGNSSEGHNDSSIQLNAVMPINGTHYIPSLPQGGCPAPAFPNPNDTGCVVVTLYTYWIQDVVEIDSSNSSNGNLRLDFLDNIWNLSGGNMSGGASIGPSDSSTVEGNGQVISNCPPGCIPPPAYYVYTAPNNTTVQGYGHVHLPIRVNLSIVESMITNRIYNPPNPPITQERPHVAFLFSVDWPGSSGTKWFTYDNVSFFFVNATWPFWGTPGLTVAGGHSSGSAWWDSELVLAGDGGRSNAQLISGSLQFTLNYSDAGIMRPVPSAWNYGSDTGETSTNVNAVWTGGPLFDGGQLNYSSLTSGTTTRNFLRSSIAGTTLSLTRSTGVTVGYNESTSGTGFGRAQTVEFWLWYPSDPITNATRAPGGTCTTDSSGSFSSCWLTIPPVTNGTYDVIATDGIYTATSSVSITPTIVLSETSGKAGSPVTINATGLPTQHQIFVGFASALNPNTCPASWSKMNSTFVRSPDGSYTWFSHIPSALANVSGFVALNESNSCPPWGMAFSPYRVPSPSLAIKIVSFTSLYGVGLIGHRPLIGDNWTLIANGSGFKPYSPIGFSAATNYSYSAHPPVGILGKCDALASGSFVDCEVNVTVWYANSLFSPPVPNTYTLTVSAHDDQWSIGSPIPGTTGWVQVGSGPTGITYSSRTGYLFVTNYNSGTVSVVSNSTLSTVATIPVGQCPSGVVYDGAKNEIAVANSCSSSISIIDATSYSQITTIALGGNPASIGYDRVNGEFFAAGSSSGNHPLMMGAGSGSVSVINDTTNQVVATITVGNAPAGIAYDELTGDAYVSNQGNNSLSVISAASNTVVGTIAVGTSPSAVAIDYSTNEVAVTNTASGTVSIINASTFATVATVGVGSSPEGIASDPLDGLLLVTSLSGNSVYAINDTSLQVVATIAIGSGPIGVTWSSGSIWVTNSNTNGISYINWTYTATATIIARPL